MPGQPILVVMTAEQIHLLRKSFDAIERETHVAALVFYQRLFALDPSLRPLFKRGIEEQSRKLMDMLGLAVSLATSPAVLERELRELGARHHGYGVRLEHYETVGRALLEMLAEVLDAEFTPPVRETWTGFYQFMARTMQAGAAAATQPQTAAAAR
jgi:hemoglobin-like flavoprotein